MAIFGWFYLDVEYLGNEDASSGSSEFTTDSRDTVKRPHKSQEKSEQLSVVDDETADMGVAPTDVSPTDEADEFIDPDDYTWLPQSDGTTQHIGEFVDPDGIGSIPSEFGQERRIGALIEPDGGYWREENPDTKLNIGVVEHPDDPNWRRQEDSPVTTEIGVYLDPDDPRELGVP